MLAGPAISAAVSPASLPRRNRSPLNPLFRPRASAQPAPTTTTTKTHLSNLDRLLHKQQAQAPPFPTHDHPPPSPPRGGGGGGGGGIFDCLNLPSLFPSRATTEQIEMSPRSLTRLQRLLSDTTRPSPRNAIAPTWHQYHGAGDWAGLLDPLDENLRRELIRCGDLVQSAYHAFHSNPSVPPNHHRPVILPDRSYKVTRSLYATASVELPGWVTGVVAPWMTQRTSWIGFVAVCDNEREIHRMGRRDIVISLRGTATCLEWAENFRAGLIPIDNNSNDKVTARVECGFWSLYKTAGAGSTPSLSEAVVEEVNRLMDVYKGEELSITVTGHSLGAALAVLAGDELSRLQAAPPVAVFSFGGPRVGNRGFADRVRKGGAKVLRVVNANDVVTRVPVKMPAIDGYEDVGTELKVDSKVSPYLRPDADPACCHDLEAYLHLVDGFLGSHCPFRSNAKRSLARLLNEQGSNVKKLYMAKARDLAVDPAAVAGAGSNVASCLPSPSH